MSKTKTIRTRKSSVDPAVKNLLLALWDTQVACCKVMHAHRSCDGCDICTTAAHVRFLLAYTQEMVEDSIPPHADLEREWMQTRGRPEEFKRPFPLPNPFTHPPAWGDPADTGVAIPPAGTAEAWDGQFTTINHQFMEALWGIEQALEGLQQAHVETCSCVVCTHAQHFAYLIQTPITELETGALGILGHEENWPRTDWRPMDREPEADVPVLVE